MTYPSVDLPDQFGHPNNPRSVLEDATIMHNTTDVPLNALSAYMFGMPTLNLARLRLSHRAVGTTAVASSGTIKFDTTEVDSAGGWNVGTGLYTVPAAGGLFLVTAHATTASAVNVRILLTGIPTAVFATGNINGAAIQSVSRSSRIRMIPIRFSGGETVGVRVSAAINLEGTTAGAEKHRFEMIQIGH